MTLPAVALRAGAIAFGIVVAAHFLDRVAFGLCMAGVL